MTDTSAIDGMTDLLRREIAAIEAGDFEAVEALRPEKEELATAMEPLESTPPEALLPEMRAKLVTLRDLVARDAELLERMRAASADIGQALNRVRDRHTLGGLYGKSGQKVDRNAAPAGSLDRSL